MSTLTYQKTRNASYLLGLAGLITMPHLVFGLVQDLSHLMTELVHYLFAMLASVLDQLVEQVFHTDMRETRLIVFSLKMAMGVAGLYCLCWALLLFLANLKIKLLTALQQGKTHCLNYWAESAANKFKMIAAFHVGLTVIVLFGL